MQVDPGHVDECKPNSQNLAKWNRGAQGTSGNTRTPLLMSRKKTLKHQAEVEAEFHLEEENQKSGSNGEEFTRSTATSNSPQD